MFRSEKPVTAVTVLIERLTKEEYGVDELSDIDTLIEAIRIQKVSGAREAARAIRKKLKYGNVHRQLRALTILDDLVQNAGPTFQRSFADEMLLERLRILVTDPVTDQEVKQKCQALYRQWAVSYKATPGMEAVASLHKQLPQRKKPRNVQQSAAIRETERLDDDDDEAEETQRRQSVTAGTGRRKSSVTELQFGYGAEQPSSSSFMIGRGGGIVPQAAYPSKPKKDKKNKNQKVKPFDFEKEKPRINQVITETNVEATGLINTLKHINKETQRVSENPDAKRRFERCKALRKQTFRYCSLVMDEAYLGTLLNANDQLMEVLILYEQLDRAFDYDSDSEDYEGGGAHGPTTTMAKERAMAGPKPVNAAMAGLTLSPTEEEPLVSTQLPRPVFAQSFARTPIAAGKAPAASAPIEEDDADPFADSNAVATPALEKSGMSWRDV